LKFWSLSSVIHHNETLVLVLLSIAETHIEPCILSIDYFTRWLSLA
jgi:hypothetical protein